MTVSLWQRTAVSNNARSGDAARAEVIIIGAGICGISAALHLQRRGIEPLIIERGRIGGVGSGASARNAGFLMRGAAENYAAAIRTYGREMARLIWRWTEESLAGLRSEGIDGVPGYSARPSCLLALEEVEHAELRESVMLLREDGFDVEWRDQGDDLAWRNLRPLGGLLNPNDGVCHPVNLLAHLRGKVKRPPVEECEVVGIRGGTGGMVEVLTGRGVFESSRVLVCTNAYVPLLLPEMTGVVAPRRGQILAVEAPGGRLDHAYYANYGYEYFRQVNDRTLIFGGCRKAHAPSEVGYEDHATSGVQRDIEAFAARTLGVSRSELSISDRWTGTMGFSPDGLPLVGPVEGEWDRGSVCFCGGFTGHGMSLAHRVSRSAVEVLLDGVESPLALARVKSEAEAAPAATPALPS